MIGIWGFVILLFQSIQQLLHRLIVHRMTNPGRDLRQRNQHEIPLVHLDVGDVKLLVIEDQVVVQEDVQIQCPGTPVDDANPVGFLLQLVETIQEFVRRQDSPDLHDAVQEFILLGVAVGLGSQVVGNCFYDAALW